MSVITYDTLVAWFGPNAMARTGMLTWYPGAPPIGEEGIETFTRSGAGAYFEDSTGTIRAAEANAMRMEYTSGALHALTEAEGDNFVLYSEDWSNWSVDGTPTSGATHTATGITLTLIGDNNGGATEKFYDDGVTTSTSAPHILRVRVKEGASAPNDTQVIVYEGTGTGTIRGKLKIDAWVDGVPTWDIVTNGTKLATVTVDASAGVYDLYMETDSLAAGTNRIDVIPASAGTSDTGDIYMGGVMLSEKRTSYIKTAGAGATRNTETLYLPLPPALQATDAAWAVYLRGEERGNIGRSGTLTLLSLCNGTTDVAKVTSAAADDGYSVYAGSNGTKLTAKPTYGQAVELVFAHDGAGTYTLDQSIAEGAVETESDALSAPASAPDRLYLNSDGGTQDGQFAWRDVAIVRGDITGESNRVSAFRSFVDQG